VRSYPKAKYFNFSNDTVGCADLHVHAVLECVDYWVVVVEAPEEVVETRSLYEQLQAQKEAKQLEYDEQHRLSV